MRSTHTATYSCTNRHVHQSERLYVWRLLRFSNRRTIDVDRHTYFQPQIYGAKSSTISGRRRRRVRGERVRRNICYVAFSLFPDRFMRTARSRERRRRRPMNMSMFVCAACNVWAALNVWNGIPRTLAAVENQPLPTRDQGAHDEQQQ